MLFRSVTGPTGAQGLIGPTGSMGPYGLQGPQGVQGPTGPALYAGYGYYGSFYDTTTQVNSVADADNVITFNTTAEAFNVSIVSGSRITFAKGGTYNIQFSAQFDKKDSGTDNVDVWIDINGTALDWSNTTLSLVGNDAKVVAAWNFIVTVTDNQYIQLHWTSTDTGLRIYAQNASTNPTRPAIPSVILTAVPVANVLQGPTGPSGGPVGPTGPTGSSGPNRRTRATARGGAPLLEQQTTTSSR